MKKRKFDWNVYVLVGLIFAVIGAIFTVTGALIRINMEAVIHSPNTHGDVRILPYIFCGLGILFLVMGLALLAWQMKKNKQIDRLIESGNYVWATVAGVKTNYAVTINGCHPSYLECHYKDDMNGKIYTFNSRDVRTTPTELVGTSIRVYVERGNYEHYYVDVESVLGGV